MTKNISVGIPRGMLFYRYGNLWCSFFRELGIEVVISEPTTQSLAEKGTSLTIDEACLALKIFFGHVDWLIGKCDYILIPRVSNYGKHRDMCARFASLYDMTRNVFRNSEQKFLPWNVDVNKDISERGAFLSVGQELGVSLKDSIRAYSKAKRETQKKWKAAVQAQNALYEKDGLKILIAAHSYVIEDPYIGKPITDFLKKNGATPIRADIVDREDALKHNAALSPTCKWEMNREIVGSIAMHKDQVDGIILISTFPCGPDAMVNEMLLRRIEDKPMLNLVLDGQNGTAGLETRLESFLDIIRFKRGLL